MIFASGKYQNKEKPLKRQRKIGLWSTMFILMMDTCLDKYCFMQYVKIKGANLSATITLCLYMHEAHTPSGDFLPIYRGRISAHSWSKIATFFSQYHVWFSQLSKVKKKKFFFFFFFFFYFSLETTRSTAYEKQLPISEWYLNTWA